MRATREDRIPGITVAPKVVQFQDVLYPNGSGHTTVLLSDGTMWVQQWGHSGDVTVIPWAQTTLPEVCR